MNIEKQKQDVIILLNLIKENPELPIIPMVSTECVFDDSHGYWMAEWSKAKVTKYLVSDDRVYQYDEDFESLVEAWMDNKYEEYDDFSDNELEELAKKIINSYKWVDAIIVYIESI